MQNELKSPANFPSSGWWVSLCFRPLTVAGFNAHDGLRSS